MLIVVVVYLIVVVVYLKKLDIRPLFRFIFTRIEEIPNAAETFSLAFHAGWGYNYFQPTRYSPYRPPDFDLSA
jgi:hypothetical protein